MLPKSAMSNPGGECPDVIRHGWVEHIFTHRSSDMHALPGATTPEFCAAGHRHDALRGLHNAEITRMKGSCPARKRMKAIMVLENASGPIWMGNGIVNNGCAPTWEATPHPIQPCPLV